MFSPKRKLTTAKKMMLRVLCFQGKERIRLALKNGWKTGKGPEGGSVPQGSPCLLPALPWILKGGWTRMPEEHRIWGITIRLSEAKHYDIRDDHGEGQAVRGH